MSVQSTISVRALNSLAFLQLFEGPSCVLDLFILQGYLLRVLSYILGRSEPKVQETFLTYRNLRFDSDISANYLQDAPKAHLLFNILYYAGGPLRMDSRISQSLLSQGFLASTVVGHLPGCPQRQLAVRS